VSDNTVQTRTSVLNLCKLSQNMEGGVTVCSNKASVSRLSCLLGCQAASIIMSADVAIQKFSFPFTCAANLTPTGEQTQRACPQVKTLETPTLSVLRAIAVVGTVVTNEAKAGSKTDLKTDLKTEVKPGLKMDLKTDLKTGLKMDLKMDLKTDLKTAPVARLQLSTSCSAPGVRSAVLSGCSVFERLAVDVEDTRPAAKRQLSSESAARTVAVVKKSALRKEGVEGPPKTSGLQVGPRGPPCSARGAPLGEKRRRRRRKDLFSSSEVFSRVDAHAMRAGQEVSGLFTQHHHDSLRLHNITGNNTRHPVNAFTLSTSLGRGTAL